VDIDEDVQALYGLHSKILMTTTENAWPIGRDQAITPESMKRPAGGGREYPLMALVTGQFPDAFQD